MAQNEILEKTREAVIAYLTSGGITDTILNLKSADDKIAPNVSVSATNAVEDFVDSGNFWVEIEVSRRHQAFGTDAKTTSDAASATLFELLEVDDLADQLSASLDDFYCFGFANEKGFTEDQDEDCWVTKWSRKAYVCSSDMDAALMAAPGDSDWLWSQAPGDTPGQADLMIPFPDGAIGWQLWAKAIPESDYSFVNDSFITDPIYYFLTPPVDGTNVTAKIRWIVSGSGNSDPETVYSEFSDPKFFVYVNP